MFKGQVVDLDARHDDVSHLEFDHAKDVLGQLVFVLWDVSGAGGERNDATDFLGAVAGIMSKVGRKADQAQESIRDGVDRCDQRPKETGKEPEDRPRNERDFFRPAQCPHLGSLLADRHVQGRDHHESECDRYDRNPACFGRDRESHIAGRQDQYDGHRRLAEGTQDQAGERDSELAGGEIPVLAKKHVLHRPRGAAALSHELVYSTGSNLHERELGGHEEAVQDHEKEGRAESPGNTECIDRGMRVRHSGLPG